MTHIEHIGTDHEKTGRELYVLDLLDADAVPSTFNTAGKYATILIAWDATNASPDAISSLARQLINAGGVYFCTWGADCERVHDIIDEEWVGNGFTTASDPTLMTTWHDDDSLADAIWFALYNAFPVDAYFDECRSVIAICIGRPDWATEFRLAFANPKRFGDLLLGSND
ncbi:MAG: hypothetical protein O3A00_14205 [Planctomycetota bacterium]|nr:hypothetical protein [Planctomycetota bacterium]